MGQRCFKGKGDKEEGEEAQATPPPRTDTAGTYGSGWAAPDEADAYRKEPGLHGSDGVLCAQAVGERTFVTGGEDGHLRLVQLGTKGAPAVHTPAGAEKHTDDVRRLHFHRPTSLLASSSRDATVKTWAVCGGEVTLQNTLAGHQFTVANVCVNDAGDRLLSGSRDNTVRLWDLQAGRQVAMDKTARNLVHCMAYVDEHTVMQGGENLKLYMWDTRSDRLQAQGEAIVGVSDQPVCMTRDPLHPHEVHVGYKGFTAASAVVRLWDARTRQVVRTFKGHDKCLCDIAFDEAGSTMATVAHDRVLRTWDRHTGDELSATTLSVTGCPTDITLLGSTAVVTTTEGETCVYERKPTDTAAPFVLQTKFADAPAAAAAGADASS